MAAAKGILLSCDRSELVDFGGHVQLNWHWTYSLLGYIKFIKRKVTIAKSKHSVSDLTGVKKAFPDEVVTMVEMEEIPDFE